jgi:hypothetical protein
MNKKKLALTLLLSSASVSVFAADAQTYTQAQFDAVKAEAKVAYDKVVKDLQDAQAAVTAAATKSVADAQAAVDKAVADAKIGLVAESEVVAAKASLAKATTELAGLRGEGYFAPAWAAVKSNRVATAVLVTTAILVGAVVHAAVSSNNDVEADDAE